MFMYNFSGVLINDTYIRGRKKNRIMHETMSWLCVMHDLLLSLSFFVSNKSGMGRELLKEK